MTKNSKKILFFFPILISIGLFLYEEHSFTQKYSFLRTINADHDITYEIAKEPMLINRWIDTEESHHLESRRMRQEQDNRLYFNIAYKIEEYDYNFHVKYQRDEKIKEDGTEKKYVRLFPKNRSNLI